MQWRDIRERYPHQWLLVEAVDAHSSSGHRVIEDMTVVHSYPDGMSAWWWISR